MFILANIVLACIVYLNNTSRVNDYPLLCEPVFKLLVEDCQAQVTKILGSSQNRRRGDQIVSSLDFLQVFIGSTHVTLAVFDSLEDLKGCGCQKLH